MQNNVIVFDLDDTLIKTSEAMLASLAIEHGDKIPHWSTVTEFGIENIVDDVTAAELKEMCERDKLFRYIQPYMHSSYILKDLIVRGYHVVILTARGGFVTDALHETSTYLNASDMPYSELIISDEGENKMAWLEHHDNILLMVDDNVRNCDNFTKSGKVDNIMLFAQPHNRDQNQYTRLHNIFQLYTTLGLS